MEQLGLLYPLSSCELIVLCTTKLSRNTHKTPKTRHEAVPVLVYSVSVFKVNHNHTYLSLEI